MSSESNPDQAPPPETEPGSAPVRRPEADDAGPAGELSDEAPETAGRPRSRLKTWLKRIAAVALVLLLLLLGLLWHLVRGYPDRDWSRTPVAAGAEGPFTGVVDVDGTPLLLFNGLPYATDFDEVNHRRQWLNGRWSLALDGDELADQRRLGDGEGWVSTTVPATYNRRGAEQESHEGHEGVAWFRHRFTPSLASSDSHWLRLTFEGVFLRCRVWLNGALLGGREGGYTPFAFDVSRYLKPGEENVLVVRADNRLTADSVPPALRIGHEAGWAVTGGIHRGVRLERIPRRWICKVAATPVVEPERRGFALAIVIHGNEAKAGREVLAVRLTDPSGRTVATKTAEVSGEAPLEQVRVFLDAGSDAPLWGPKTPGLHAIRLRLGPAGDEQRLVVRTGLRTVRVEGETLRLNGEPIVLRGIAKHEDDAALGATSSAAAIRRDMDLLAELGANYVRLSHYPHSVEVLRAARDRGLLLSEEIPLYQAGMGWVGWLWKSGRPGEFPSDRFGVHHLSRPALIANVRRELIEMIERDRNNPAILFWGIGNENYGFGDGARAFFAWLHEVSKVWDPSRPTTLATWTSGLPALDDRRTAVDAVDIASINMYHGWYFGEPRDAEGYLKRFRELHPGKPLVISECGAGAQLGRSDADGVWDSGAFPFDKTFSEEYQARIIGELHDVCLSQPGVVGFSPWCFADFPCPWFPGNPIPGTNMKGLLSRDRKPKAAWRALRERYRQAGR